MTYDSNPSELLQYLDPQVIQLRAEAGDWREAIRIAGDLLMRSNRVERSYIQAMIDLVEKLGHYIVIMPGLALPHARPEAGVLQDGISVVTLKKPVEFGHPQNDPVHMLITFCALSTDSHTTMLSQLARTLGRANFVADAIAAGSAEEIQALFNFRSTARKEGS